MNNLDVKLFKFPWRILLDGLQTHFYGAFNPMSNYFATYKQMGNDDDGQCVMKILRILNSKVQNEFVQVKNVTGDTLKHKDSFRKKIDAVLVLNAWNYYCKVQWRKNLLHLKKKVPYDPYFLEIIGIMSQNVKKQGGGPLDALQKSVTVGLRGRIPRRNPSSRIKDAPTMLGTSPENTNDTPDPFMSPQLGPHSIPNRSGTRDSGRNIRKKVGVIGGEKINMKMTIVNSLLASGVPCKNSEYLKIFGNLRISQTI
jgi:hypothetical protein